MRATIGKILIVLISSSGLMLSSSGHTANVLHEGTGETTPETRYNEVFQIDGQVRPHYRLILSAWASRVHHAEAYAKKSSDEFRRGNLDSNAVTDIARVITREEDEVTTRGVYQRERAIQAFLHDHYSGVKSYARAGLISEESVDAIIARSGEDGYKNLINGSTPLNFLYGPDLIRGPDGVLRALEDNLGFVGGFGDIVLAQEMMERLYPEIPKNYKYEHAIEFFYDLIERYKQQAKPYGGKVVFYADPNATDDSEDTRTVELFAKLGIETLTPRSARRLDFSKPDGVYVQDKDGGNREKVGFIVLNIEHSDADLQHPASLEKAILDNSAAFISDTKPSRQGVVGRRDKILKVLKSYDPRKDKAAQLKTLQDLLEPTAYRANPKEGSKRATGIVDAILSGRVGCSYSPGVEFMGDKEMYTHIEDFIRFYLHEEPIIRNIETYMLNKPGTNTINNEVLDRVFGPTRSGTDLQNWVIKPVDGRGGDGIIFGRTIKPPQVPDLIKRLEVNPARLQIQRNTPPSVMPGNRIVDQRKLTYSTTEGPVISPVDWSRSTTADLSLLMNVSAGGSVSGVFIIGEPKSAAEMCADLFSPTSYSPIF